MLPDYTYSISLSGVQCAETNLSSNCIRNITRMCAASNIGGSSWSEPMTRAACGSASNSGAVRRYQTCRLGDAGAAGGEHTPLSHRYMIAPGAPNANSGEPASPDRSHDEPSKASTAAEGTLGVVVPMGGRAWR